MILVEETEPVGELEAPFPPQNVQIKKGRASEFYSLDKEIGRGKFGVVYECREKSTALRLAAKFIKVPKKADRLAVEREIDIMKSLVHPKLIQLYDAYDDGVKEMCLILELIEGGELFERVIDDDFILTEKACAIFVRQICEGVGYMHQQSILHLDMKPENILCISQNGNRIKLIDFGLARKFDPKKKLQVLFGTPEFVAPEVVNFDQIGYGTDIWSIGVISYVLLSGLSPFMGDSDVETMANVTIAKYDYDDEAFDDITDDAKDFITKLLVKETSKRMTAAQCLQHPWLRRRSPPESQPLAVKEEFPPLISVTNQLPPLPSLGNYVPPLAPPTSRPPLAPPARQPPLTLHTGQTSHFALPVNSMPNNTVTTSLQENQVTEVEIVTNNNVPVVKVKPVVPPKPKKTKEELELTKENLRHFVERWNSHPNSPYIFDSPRRSISTGLGLPLPLITNQPSQSSIRPMSPSPRSSVSSVFEANNADDFVHYTFEQLDGIQSASDCATENLLRSVQETLTNIETSIKETCSSPVGTNWVRERLLQKERTSAERYLSKQSSTEHCKPERFPGTSSRSSPTRTKLIVGNLTRDFERLELEFPISNDLTEYEPIQAKVKPVSQATTVLKVLEDATYELDSLVKQSEQILVDLQALEEHAPVIARTGPPPRKPTGKLLGSPYSSPYDCRTRETSVSSSDYPCKI